ncbi:polysaccharide deacetylase family protein [Chelatococcus asaccharovorans]|uniref:Chitooligosaccharide deacetylase n=1 Tax=Chelatococcus asaccharovorans TaxID=28210 RepID=A0A2V3UHN5_9HYPH|nr:polysaccharide deacetylase family protein [Chelatococcus asaccharovorans]MBS7706475.1 polysaccharide deacetylase family protein [Chelatococcus asaccharovorans]PXW64882.1 peptidoglycan/xylan/chitin deacetylase (PgdA/CDA1 family) [Chelatococcus asaccharovorans]
MKLREFMAGLARKAGRHLNTQPLGMRNREPLVSFTFDDIADSAARHGAAILDAHGIKGTFYVAAGLLGTRDEFWNLATADDIRRLNAAGHEIGCHTHDHRKVDELSAAELAAQCDANHAALTAICGPIDLPNFAYPFGRQSLPRKRDLQRRFTSCRSVYEGLNAGRIDRAMLRVTELYDRTLTADKLARTLDAAAAQNGWVIFYTHDVADNPSWIGASPRLMTEVIEAVEARGFPCVTVREALARIGLPEA